VSDPPLLSVIVPVFNERLTLRRLLARVQAVPISKEIVIVDDASTDGTADVVRAVVAEQGGREIRAVFHTRNQGKGAAIRSAVPEVRGQITLIQDADLEYDPADYPNLIAPILAGKADVVYGSRFLAGHRRVHLFRHTMGNRLLTLLSNLCTDLNLTDMETCYKVFRTDLLKRLDLVSNRFGIEPEITAKIARMDCRIYEVPISYDGRDYWEGKKIGWRDGVAAVWTILRFAVSGDGARADPGQRTLQRLRHARRYNEWVWSLIAPHVGDRVLEVGCGVGNFTRYLRNHEHVVATDQNEIYLAALRKACERWDNITIRRVDWETAEVDELRTHAFDTVLCLNVLEHILDDDRALATFGGLLAPGGRLVLQVPAMHELYGSIDRAIDHHRRYERDELVALVRRHGFEVEHARYFNAPGIVGWYLNSVLLRRRAVPGVQARMANLLVPWLRLEQRLQLPWGMALLLVARKTAAPARLEAVPAAQPAPRTTSAGG